MINLKFVGETEIIRENLYILCIRVFDLYKFNIKNDFHYLDY